MALSGLLVVVFVSIFGLIGCDNDGPETSLQIIRDITPQEAYDLIQDNQGNRDFMIIDVRTQGSVPFFLIDPPSGFEKIAAELDACEINFAV